MTKFFLLQKFKIERVLQYGPATITGSILITKETITK